MVDTPVFAGRQSARILNNDMPNRLFTFSAPLKDGRISVPEEILHELGDTTHIEITLHATDQSDLKHRVTNREEIRYIASVQKLEESIVESILLGEAGVPSDSALSIKLHTFLKTP